MKRLLIYIPLFVALTGLLVLQSCKDDDGPSQTEAERVTELLTDGTWTMESVMVDETNYTDDFTGLTLSFDETTMTSTNGKALFETSTTWTFESDEATAIVTGNDRTMMINSISSNSLVIEFDVDADIFGRAEAVGGTNVITFTR